MDIADTARLDRRIAETVDALAEALQSRQWRLCTAESCTGGWIAKVCTDATGSSAWFDSGLVCYSYAAKERQLGVIRDDLLQHGAVSEEIASQMALGRVGSVKPVWPSLLPASLGPAGVCQTSRSGWFALAGRFVAGA